VSPPGLNWTALSPLTYGTILIDGNDELDKFPNKTGNGIPGNPYVIKNLK
jgi:hypothetical protein